jgi:pyruvate dehydrogenase (quinone)
VPPLPPHITVKQAAALSKALLKGDPDWRGIVRQTYREMLATWKPHRG